MEPAAAMQAPYQRRAGPSILRRPAVPAVASVVALGLLLTGVAAQDAAGPESMLALGLVATALAAGAVWTACAAPARRADMLTDEIASRLEAEDALSGANRMLAEAVADREALVEQKDVLLREMNHRIKNNLQLMGALLQLHRLRVRDPDAQRAFDDVLARLEAVSRIHERLQPSGDRLSVRMDRYLDGFAETLASALGMEHASGLDVAADPVELLPDQAVPVALIANELVTNALKYGTPDSGRPRVDLALRLSGETVRLEVRDYGAGPRAAGEARAGLGTTLTRSLADQLGGTVVLEDAAPGCRAVLTFPLEGAAERTRPHPSSDGDASAGPGWHDSPSQQSPSTRPAGHPQAR